jgi:peptide/nickel transport system substrate-binding protein
MQFSEKLMKRGYLLLGLTFSLLLLAAVACGGTAATPVVVEKQVVVEKEVIKEVVKEVQVVVTAVPTPTAVPAAAKQVFGQLRGVISEEASTYDIHRLRGGIDNSFQNNVYERLRERSQDNLSLLPGLAESWDVSPDGLVWTFHLRKGVKFHNGDVFDANEYLRNWERVQDPDIYRSPSRLKEVTSIKALDDSTVEMVFGKFNLRFTWQDLFGLAPVKWIEENGDEAFENNPLGTGPYRFVEKSTKEWFLLERFEDYWGLNVDDGRGFYGAPSAWDEYKVTITPEELTMLALLATDRVDILMLMGPAVQRSIKEFDNLVSGTVGWRSVSYMLPCHPDRPFDLMSQPWCKGMNTDNDTGLKVRTALNLAVDHQATSDLYEGLSMNKSVMFPGATGATKKNSDPYPYDPERAKELMEEAGYPNCFEMEMINIEGRLPRLPELAEMVANYLQTNLGCTINIKQIDYREWIEYTGNAKPPWPTGIMYAMDLGGNTTGEPVNSLCHRSTSWGTNSHFADDEMDKWCGLAENEPNEKKRIGYLEKAGDRFYDMVPGISTSAFSYAYAWNQDKVDFTPSVRSGGFVYMPDAQHAK